MQRRFLIMEVSDLFAIWFIVFLVLLTCIIVSSVILLSAFFSSAPTLLIRKGNGNPYFV